MTTLIDSSALIEFLRPDGDARVAAAVAEVFDAGDAATCPLIELELWNGPRDTSHAAHSTCASRNVVKTVHVVGVTL